MREFSNHAVLSMSDSTMAVSSRYTQDLSVQIVFFTFTCKWFLCFYFWAVIWSYIVDLFAALHELASASSRTLLKLASSVRALLKPYGDTLNKLIIRKLRLSEQSGFDPWHFPLTVPLSIQVHKWVNLMVEVTLQWTNIPYRGKQNTPSRFMPLKLT